MKNASEMFALAEQGKKDAPATIVESLYNQLIHAARLGEPYILLYKSQEIYAKEFEAMGYKFIPATDRNLARLSCEPDGVAKLAKRIDFLQTAGDSFVRLNEEEEIHAKEFESKGYKFVPKNGAIQARLWWPEPKENSAHGYSEGSDL